MSKYDLVVFDLDGTLTDSGNTIYRTTIKTLKQLGIKGELPQQEFSKKIGAHFKDIFEDFNINVEDLEHFINVYKSYYFEFIAETFIYEGVVDILKTLKQRNIKVALLTTKSQDQADRIIDYFKLREYFDMVTGRRPGLGIKPDPQPLLFICAEMNVEPGKTLMVGDSEMDINCGRNAKTGTCAVSYGFRGKKELELENPDYLIESITRLTEIIEL